MCIYCLLKRTLSTIFIGLFQPILYYLTEISQIQKICDLYIVSYLLTHTKAVMVFLVQKHEGLWQQVQKRIRGNYHKGCCYKLIDKGTVKSLGRVQRPVLTRENIEQLRCLVLPESLGFADMFPFQFLLSMCFQSMLFFKKSIYAIENLICVIIQSVKR